MLRRILDALRDTLHSHTARTPRPQARIIRCPECGYVQAALVEWLDGAPWPSFGHTCQHCGYEILESEWEEITPFHVPEDRAVLYTVRPYQGHLPPPRKLAGTEARPPEAATGGGDHPAEPNPPGGDSPAGLHQRQPATQEATDAPDLA